jgi:hypothetical protein
MREGTAEVSGEDMQEILTALHEGGKDSHEAINILTTTIAHLLHYNKLQRGEYQVSGYTITYSLDKAQPAQHLNS